MFFYPLETYTWKYDTDKGFSYSKGNSLENFLSSNDDELLSLLASFFVILVVSVIIACIVVTLANHKQNNAPSLTVKAKIVDKNPSASPDCLDTITFEFENGECKTLYLKGCHAYNIGDEGELVYKNKKFIDFKTK